MQDIHMTGTDSDKLKYSNLKIINFRNCQAKYRPVRIYYGQLCAWAEGTGPCTVRHWILYFGTKSLLTLIFLG